MSVNRSIQIRLYPNKKQRGLMSFNLECCRFVYNEMLEYCNTSWESNHERHTFFDLNRKLVQMKKDHLELNGAYSACLSESINRVTKAYANFFRNLNHCQNSGYPRFKSANRYHSFTYPTNNGFKILDSHKLKLGKIGEVKYRGNIDKFLIEAGKQKTCTLSFSSTGKIYATICFEMDEYHKNTESFINKGDVGVDLNVKNMATLSNGIQISNNKHLDRNLARYTKIEKKMSKYEPKSIHREKYKRHLNHLFEKIINRRNNDAHQVSNYLIRNYSRIFFEDIDLKSILEKTDRKAIHRAFYDVGWSKLVRYTGYKAEGADIQVIKVNPAYTTQLCSKCGNIVIKDLSERMHHCGTCGLTIDRDVNAAINILKRGRGCRPLPSMRGINTCIC